MAKRRPETDLPRTVAEFDAWNAQQPERWEFIGGQPVMMAPASLPHTIIKTNIGRHLGNRLVGSGCRVYVDGAEVKSHRLSAIPDVVVACGLIDQSSPAIAAPVLIVEVVSPSTECDDTERKWHSYCLIESLQHYLVVAQESRFVILHARTGPSSFAETLHLDGSIELSALGVSLSLDEIYEDVIFLQQAAADD